MSNTHSTDARHRPDYDAAGPAPRRPAWRRVVAVAMAVAVAGSFGFAFFAKGRGYKTYVMSRIYPDDPRYLVKPTVREVRPGDREDRVMPDAFIAADVNLQPGRVIDKNTLEGSVLLLKGNAREKVPAYVNTSGGGDAIVLRPQQPLELNALYTFVVLPALKDTGGAPFVPFSSSFSTAAGTVYSEYPAAGTKVEQRASMSADPTRKDRFYTGVTFGPDGKLYASTIAGQILRFDVSADGTLGNMQMIMTVLGRERGPRIMTGITFDPKSTADHLIAYVAHGVFPYGDPAPSAEPAKSHGGTPHGLSTKQIPDWSSKITRLSGPNLENAEDLVVGLPRARHDHTTGQIAFGPDGAMYFAQASNTAMGAPDNKWGMRPERLLTTCVMRLDLAALDAGSKPLRVQTEEGHAYDPFAANAPLTIWATGTRNCYDLLFHSNGQFYATLNGSAAGGSVPATPPGGRTDVRRFDAAAGTYDFPPVAQIDGVGTQNDYLLRIDRGGYYGHPNPTRAEFVMNGGNPSAGKDPCEVVEYPVGTPPDRNWRRPTFDFGKNLSPCGMTEYAGDAFPALKGKVLVVRFSGGKDIVALTPDEQTGEVREFVTGLDGFTHFHDPVDLCVSPKTGFIYVAEHTGQKITLVKPIPGGVSKRVLAGDSAPPGSPPPATRPAAEKLPTAKSE